MTSNRPYLIRAIYDWIVDNQQTPHLIVDARVAGVVVPPQAVRDGIVVLNISMSATADLELGNEFIRFNARFSGVSRGITIPVGAVLAIRSREQGLGMVFSPETFGIDESEDGDEHEDGDQPEESGFASGPTGVAPAMAPVAPVPMASVPMASVPIAAVPGSDPPGELPTVDPDRPRRGHLRVIK